MRFSAELHSSVVAYLRFSCSPAEVADFYAQLERVRDDPIGTTLALVEPGLSRYALRWFPFGVGIEKVVICHFDGKIVRVLKCRLSEPRRERGPREPPATT